MKFEFTKYQHIVIVIACAILLLAGVIILLLHKSSFTNALELNI